MTINGIASLIYGVEDLDLATRFLVDFGLPLTRQSAAESRFDLAEGSNVIIRPLASAQRAGSSLVGFGVQEVIWGVSDAAALERLVEDLERDRTVIRDADGSAHFLADDGLAIGLCVYPKRFVAGAPDPVNSLHSISRLNIHRKWRSRARPKTIQHVVFNSPDPDASWAFYRDRLGFRLSDVQKGFGIFGRADGCTDHHNIYFLNANLPFPNLDGQMRFNHANFGVEDIDEVMTGANYMARRGWPKSRMGLGRHRIASALFFYLPSPLGGEAEFGADSDALDDNWVPRTWNARFGVASWIHDLPDHLMDDAPWEVEYTQGHAPGATGAARALPMEADAPPPAPNAEGRLPSAEAAE